MKYSDQNPPFRCILYDSTCYRGTRTFTPKGILWHSTGAPNKAIRRYCQPSKKDKNYSQILDILGYNQNHNSWNEIERQAGVNAWVGEDKNGNVMTCQSLEWTQRPWGCGSGKKGSLNNTHLQVEVCEDYLNDAVYFNKVYTEACELSAYLCKKFGWDPHGTIKFNGVVVPVITCHWQSYELGLGSGHVDVKHWWPKFGKYMEEMRDDVAKIMAGGSLNSKPQQSTPTPKPEPPKQEPKPQPPKEDDDMDVKRFGELMDEYRKTLQDNDAADWSKAARDWAVSSGLIQGGVVNGTPNYMWADYLTREQLAQTLYRFAQMMGKA